MSASPASAEVASPEAGEAEIPSVQRAAGASVWKREVRETLILGLPLAGSQLAQILLSTTDTVMAGHYDKADLAAVALGGSIYFPLSLFGMGVLLAVSPTVSQLYGAERHTEIGRTTHQGLWIAAFMGVMTLIAAYFVEPLLGLMKVQESLVRPTMGYITAISWGLPALFGQVALRGMSAGVSRPRPMLVISLLSFPMNVLFNWVFMYGKFGMPQLGGVGCGVASAIVLWLNFLMMAGWVRYYTGYRAYHVFERWDWPDWKEIRSLFHVGAPIAVGMFMECSLFAAGALLLGRFSDTVVAAHQAALNMASVTFMIPLGLSQASSIRVGQAVGRKDYPEVRRAGFVGIGMSAAIMVVSGTCLALFPRAISALYTNNPEVISLMARLLFYAAIFQVFDGLQVSSISVLRGLKDTAVPAGITVVAYWALGLPLAWYLGVFRGHQADGVWMGFILALVVAATLLTLRFEHSSRKLLATREHDS
jgi:MATE family multidrug resistance protein